MLKISSTSFHHYIFSVIYDTHLRFSGFFEVESLPTEFSPPHLIQDTSTLAKEICAWYMIKGNIEDLPLPMQLTGTPFQKKVWSALSQIPKGESRHYSEIAAEIGHLKAARAVGTACGKNPLSLIIPCHRVLGQTSLGGYRWGLDIKKSLLQYESLSQKAVAEQ